MTAIRIGILGLIAFSVLAYGSVEVWSASIVEITAVVLLLSWVITTYRHEKSSVQWSPLCWPLLGLIAFGLFQVVFRWTAYPFLTQTEILKIAAYLIVFFLMMQLFRTRSQFAVLAWFLMIFCFGISLLGILQFFTSRNQIYWLTTVINGDLFGPFVNRNHFAGFVELIVPVGLALMVFRGLRSDLVPLVSLLTLVPISAVILSGSRGGIVCLAVEFVFLAVLVRGRRTEERPNIRVIGMVAIAAAALIAWVGAGKAIQRFSELPKGDVTADRRFSMFRGAAGIFLDHPVKGSGLGTLVAVYPHYETLYDGLVVGHVHNDYIELLAETGIIGGLCGLAFLMLLYRESLKRSGSKQGSFSQGLHTGAIVALSGLLLHSLVDFNLHIPSNALLFVVQASVAISPPLLTDSHHLGYPMNRERRSAADVSRSWSDIASMH